MSQGEVAKGTEVRSEVTVLKGEGWGLGGAIICALGTV